MLPTHLEHIRSLTDLSVKRGFVERSRDESIRAAWAKPKRDRLRVAQSALASRATRVCMPPHKSPSDALDIFLREEDSWCCLVQQPRKA